MFINKWALLVRVAAVAGEIPTGQVPDLAQCRAAMNVVAVAALHQSLFNPVVIRFGKIRFRRSVASIAELRLALHQQVLRLGCVVGAVAV